MRRLIIIILLPLVVSCSDFMKENPKTQFSKDQVYSTENGAQAALNACYAYVSSTPLYGQKIHILLSGSAGTMTIANTNSQYLVDLASLNIQTNNSAVEDVYGGSYQAINTINDVLINLPGSPIDESVKERIMGEAYFLRAQTYFNLVRLFGPLPYVVQPAGSFDEVHRPRSPINEIYALILDDLDKAWEMMPERGMQPYGRPHRYAAKYLLSKVYMTLACISEFPDEPFDASWLDKSTRDYWQLCYDNALEVYTNGGYSLVSDFAELWDCYNRYTTESIFELEENKITGSCSFMYHYLPGFWEGVPHTTSNNNYGRIRALRESWDEHFNTYPEDYRMRVTYIDTLYYRNTAVADNPGGLIYMYPYTRDNMPPDGSSLSSAQAYPYVKKYVDERFTATDANVNVIVYRFADVLLTLAEAANELGRTSEGVGYVNRLLQRARNTPDGLRTQPEDWPLSLTADEFRQQLYVERRLELKGELYEWFDNRRRGAAHLRSIMQAHNDKLYSLSRFESYDYEYDMSETNVIKNLLCPFPMAEITSNNNITDQDQNRYY